jgi:glycine C-acetyltransferase
MSAAAATLARLAEEAKRLSREGLYKREAQLTSPQGAEVTTEGGRRLLNLCSNNYLGLADDPRIIAAAHEGLDRHGFGVASVRFICGTQAVHRELEGRLAAFLGTEDAILFGSCFDANAGIFEALLDERDAVVSDALNHASIIDGIRLCKARRLRYASGDMGALEQCLKEAADARTRLVVTDGVFSMDGVLADLPAIRRLADAHDAIVMVDDSHAVGVLGARGAGTPEHFGLKGRIDILTGTFGKALGGAAGGYVAGAAPLVDWLRQRARPYLFSNALMPAITVATIGALDILAASPDLLARLRERTRQWREGLKGAGFRIGGEIHPIVPILLGDARLAGRMAEALGEEGIHAVAFSYPVVPEGAARIRTQVSAAHTAEDLERALGAFTRAARQAGVAL